MIPAPFSVVLTIFSAIVFMDDPDPAASANARLGRGVNFGNALEAEREGAWGVVLRDDFFEKAREARFNSVRIPIRWSAHAKKEAPFTIDPAFFERVDWALDQATSRGLNAVINFHHFEELYADPAPERDRFLALWKQVAEHYHDQPDSVYFEILNEPHAKLDADAWNDLLPSALEVIRQSNPNRFVIVGPAQWNNWRALDQLQLPDTDRRLIVTFHYYDPFQFTHQGAEWVQNSAPWLGTTWSATPAQKAEVTKAFDTVSQWAHTHNRPIYLGEFGAYSKADANSRAHWTSFIAREAERHQFSWAYWEFAAGFGIYDPQTRQWRSGLLEALVPDRTR